MSRHLIFLFLLAISLRTFSQKAAECQEVKFDIGNTELLVYKVSYNLGFIWIDAGKVDFNFKTTKYKDQDAFHFLSTGLSEKKWDWIFKLRDTFEVYSDSKTMKPFDFERKSIEGSNNKHHIYHFDYQNKFAYSEITDNEKKTIFDTIPLSTCVFDILSATYLARTMDFSHSWISDTIPLRVLHDGLVFDLPIIYHGNETINNQNDTISCTKFSTLIKRSSLFSKGENLTVWVSNDKYKTPVLIEAKIVVGSIKVSLINRKNE